jgi:hypothetical protein
LHAQTGQSDLPAYSHPGAGEKVLSFYANMAQHGVSFTHGGHPGMSAFPPGIPMLSEPGIKNGLIADLKLADKEGKVIGFAGELEVFPEGRSPTVDDNVEWQTVWTLVLPGRGTIFLEQIEHSGGLGPKVIQPVLKSGQDWVGDWWITTTVGPLPNRRGRIVAGTGEFAGIRGSFVEIDHLTAFRAAGVMELSLELRLFPE